MWGKVDKVSLKKAEHTGVKIWIRTPGYGSQDIVENVYK